MEEYAEELRTPPVGLVALVGCNEHHEVISKHLQAEQPPINILTLPDISSLSKLLLPSSFKIQKNDSGILRRDWLSKHRTRIPSVVVVLIHSDHLSGDLADALQLLENLKNTIRPRIIQLVVVVVVGNPSSQYDNALNDERISTLRKKAELDSKHLLIFNPNDSSLLKQSLSRVAATFSELSLSYYRDEGLRIKARVEKRSFNYPDLIVRYCFKVAVYAEFRRDWEEALRFYEDAYQTLREMVGTSTRLPPIQRLIQIKTVAEQLHFKVLTLLLHKGKLVEALTWYRKHITSYKKLLGDPQAAFLHWDWMSRQFLVIAELLETTSKLNPASSAMSLQSSDRAFSEWEFQPAYYYHIATTYLKEKQTALKLAITISEATDQVDGRVDSVGPSAFLGQFVRLLEHEENVDIHPLTDEEFVQYSINEGKRFQDAYEIIALLKRCYQIFDNLKAQRMASFCGFKLAVEYYHLKDFENAIKFFNIVASAYRKEGWMNLLWEVLGYLRQCSKKSKLVKDFIEYSLEMAALSVDSDTTWNQKEIILQEVLASVGAETSSILAPGEGPIHLEIDLISPLRSVLLASVAFHDQVLKPGASASLTLSLVSQLPLPIEIDHLEVKFNQSDSNFTIINTKRSPTSDGESGGPLTSRVKKSISLTLETNKWLRLTYDVQTEHSGKLECLYIIAKIGSHLIISCRAESPASMDDIPLSKYENRVETSPIKDATLSLLGQKVAHVQEPDPRVDLLLGPVDTPFVGECFTVPVVVVAREQTVISGELKFYIVDSTTTESFTPRESESLSPDGHHVEFVSFTAEDSEIEAEAESGSDERNKIRKSFGVFSIPSLQIGESWSCGIQIKWYRPKSVILYASLSSADLNIQKVHVHKNLYLSGKYAIQIRNLFIPLFRQEPLLNPSDGTFSLPVHLSSSLAISVKNCSEISLELKSISIELANEAERSCKLQNGDTDSSVSVLPEGECKRVFSITPFEETKNMSLGSAVVSWRRTMSSSWVLTRIALPSVNIELPPLVINLEFPLFVVIATAFTFVVKIKNQTRLPEEIKFGLADGQSFVVSGSQNDTVLVLPNSEHKIGFIMVPLAAGSQVLPRVTVTSLRHSACFCPANSTATIFVYPYKCIQLI